jgi:DNA invertase Pin-like site-specific DNA recombinase
MIYGYARTSAYNQRDNNSEEVQRDELAAAGAQEIVYENFTGTKSDRPEFSKLLKKLKKGDALLVTKLDRFARATEAAGIIKELLSRGVTVHVLNLGLINNTAGGRLMFNVLLAFAEYERDMIVERTQSGIAKKREKEPEWKEGRPKGEYPDFLKFFQKQKDGQITVEDGCKKLGISKTQWYRLVNEKQSNPPSSKSTDCPVRPTLTGSVDAVIVSRPV